MKVFPIALVYLLFLSKIGLSQFSAGSINFGGNLGFIYESYSGRSETSLIASPEVSILIKDNLAFGGNFSNKTPKGEDVTGFGLHSIMYQRLNETFLWSIKGRIFRDKIKPLSFNNYFYRAGEDKYGISVSLGLNHSFTNHWFISIEPITLSYQYSPDTYRTSGSYSEISLLQMFNNPSFSLYYSFNPFAKTPPAKSDSIEAPVNQQNLNIE